MIAKTKYTDNLNSVRTTQDWMEYIYLLNIYEQYIYYGLAMNWICFLGIEIKRISPVSIGTPNPPYLNSRSKTDRWTW